MNVSRGKLGARKQSNNVITLKAQMLCENYVVLIWGWYDEDKCRISYHIVSPLFVMVQWSLQPGCRLGTD